MRTSSPRPEPQVPRGCVSPRRQWRLAAWPPWLLAVLPPRLIPRSRRWALVKRHTMRLKSRSDPLSRPACKHRGWLRKQKKPYSLLRRPWRRQSSPRRQRRQLGHGRNGGGRVVQGRSGGHSVLRTPVPSREDLELCALPRHRGKISWQRCWSLRHAVIEMYMWIVGRKTPPPRPHDAAAAP